MSPDSSEMLQCNMCGARVEEGDRACPICGARLQAIEPVHMRAQIPHLLLSLSLIMLVIVGSAWFFSPTTESQFAPADTPTATLWPTATFTDTTTPTISPTITPSPTETPFCVLHTVAHNENIEIIAEKYGVTPTEIRESNKLDAFEPLRVGRQLCIPVLRSNLASLTPESTPTPTPLTYEVQRGDNLGSIADHFDTTVQLLVDANQLDPDKMLSVGQALLIPRIFDTPTPVTPTETKTRTLPPPTATRTQTSTPRPYAYSAPALLYPLEGADFHGPDEAIVLNWSSVTLLQPDEWYILNVYYLVEDNKQRITQLRTKDTAWRMPSSAYMYKPEFYEIEWSVITVRELPTGEVLRISPPSETRHFLWY